MENDWRLSNQDKYLREVKLHKAVFVKTVKNDHAHCEFCWAKFSEYAGDLREGYATTDEYRWICPECFQDYKDRFQWVLEDFSRDSDT